MTWFELAVQLLLLATVASEPSLKGLPEGWRLPQDGELTDKWRDKDTGRFVRCEADLNGDGAIETVVLLVSEKESAVGVWILGGSGACLGPVLIDRFHMTTLPVVGISTAPPGEYVTACGKGYFECASGDAASVRLKRPAIRVFKVESMDRVLYWDAESATFKRAWLSD